MKHAELLDENCAIARSSGIVGERWVWVILRQAFNGARRFEEYQRGIGLARNVLTDRLNWLVDAGRAQAQVPGLRVDGLRSCALYADAWTNDARLTLGNVRVGLSGK